MTKAVATPPTTTAPTTVTTFPATTAPADPQRLLDAGRAQYGSIGGTAAVDRDGVRWSGQSGVADRAGAALNADSRFRIASITKPIVAVLVLQAVHRGELSLDDDVAALLPGLLRAGPTVTVRMLLDHTSGIFDETNEGDEAADLAALTDPDLRAEASELLAGDAAGKQVVASDRLLVALAEEHPRYFAPGGGYRYSNINYQLAAMVLQRLGGRSLDEVLRTGIVDALGLSHTTLAPADRSTPEMHGYGTAPTGHADTTTGTDGTSAGGETSVAGTANPAGDGALVDLTDDLLAFGNGGNGGVISTPGDVLNILEAIVSGRLLPGDLVSQMEHPTTQSYGSYGLGLATYYFSCGTFYGHGGAIDGTDSIAVVDPTGRTGVVVAFNRHVETGFSLPDLAERFVCGAS